MNPSIVIDKNLLTRALYSTDASIYQIFPDGVICPTSIQDIGQIIEIVKKQGSSLTPRGAGTSLAGQTIGKGVILDFSKYLNNTLQLDVDNKTVKVEPGLILDELNHVLKPDNLHFAPDPATSSRATIGGMIANNSSGTKSILYGKTSDHLMDMDVMLYDGSIIHCDQIPYAEVLLKAKLPTLEGTLYHTLLNIVLNGEDAIESAFPHIMRRVSGYSLNAFKKNMDWNLSDLFCGSEGTLGIILNATLRLTPIPKKKAIALLHYDDRKNAINDVQHIVKSGPSAVEMCDQFVLEQCKLNIKTSNLYYKYIHSFTDTILIVEFFSDDEQIIDSKYTLLKDILTRQNSTAIVERFDDMSDMTEIWSIRKKGLGLLMGKKSSAKPIAFIEDSSLPLDKLSTYIDLINQECIRLEVPVVIYAHASVGVLHIRPILDLRKEADIERMKVLSSYSFYHVKKLGGSWSGEHGDGRVRGPKLRTFFGDKVYEFMLQIKRCLDPALIFNPNVLITDISMDMNLRLGTSYYSPPINTTFEYQEENSFEDIVHNCSGIGACVKQSGGVMCPSFRATKNEKDSTRGRANVIRLVMSNQLGDQELSGDMVQEVLQYCLSCKACKSECPSNVDMAKLKSEVNQIRFHKYGIPPSIRMASQLSSMGAIFAGPLSQPVNFLGRLKPVKFVMNKIFNLTDKRNLPEFAKTKFNKKFDSIPQIPHSRKVGLYADCYSLYYENALGESTLILLNKLGYQVELLESGCCQRPSISNGLLDSAKKNSIRLNQTLTNYDNDLVVLEPSCLSALKYDIPDLHKDISRNSHIFSLASFLEKEKIQLPQVAGRPILVHGHCHEKALESSENIVRVLTKLGYDVILLDTSCCGMAGTFGYQKATYEVSLKVAEMSILPALAKFPNADIVATGFSCRHQITDLTDRTVRHWVEYVCDDLNIQKN